MFKKIEICPVTKVVSTPDSTPLDNLNTYCRPQNKCVILNPFKK